MSKQTIDREQARAALSCLGKQTVVRGQARAALCYLQYYVARAHVYTNEFGLPGITDGPKSYRKEPVPDDWPFAKHKWKPVSPMQDLLQARQLLDAEIGELRLRSKQKADA